MDGPRHIWWNFVASSKERIEAAKEAWRAGDFTHGDAGSNHEVNYSDEGCVRLAVLTTADPLVAMALA